MKLAALAIAAASAAIGLLAWLNTRDLATEVVVSLPATDPAYDDTGI